MAYENRLPCPLHWHICHHWLLRVLPTNDSRFPEQMQQRTIGHPPGISLLNFGCRGKEPKNGRTARRCCCRKVVNGFSCSCESPSALRATTGAVINRAKATAIIAANENDPCTSSWNCARKLHGDRVNGPGYWII